MEIVIGGMAAVGAGTFSNPLEVVKIRMQLQGELQARGKYVVHYKNAFHAAYVIGTKDGLIALQKGLVPALWYQFVMNGTRLGTYQIAEKQGWTRRKDGQGVEPAKALIAGSIAGIIGAIAGSPFYLVKTHLQSKANEKAIAVGHQHEYKGMTEAMRGIYKNHGIVGLWRGGTSAIPRVAVASGVQMLTFEKALEWVRSLQVIPHDSWMVAFCASMMSGIFVSLSMSPFDLIATRFYNQAVDVKGKGILYRSLFDVARKVHREEGALGFFKGWTANYFRIGPHTLLLMVFWDRLKHHHRLYEQRQIAEISV